MEDIKESKKVLTDYMLELSADIQRAEDWVNTGADEEMYFALKTVLDRLEQLEKENEQHKELNVEIMTDLINDFIPKSVIREKIEEVKQWQEIEDGVNYECSLAQEDILKELLGDEQ